MIKLLAIIGTLIMLAAHPALVVFAFAVLVTVAHELVPGMWLLAAAEICAVTFLARRIWRSLHPVAVAR
jgi:hypothetical protein